MAKKLGKAFAHSMKKSKSAFINLIDSDEDSSDDKSQMKHITVKCLYDVLKRHPHRALVMPRLAACLAVKKKNTINHNLSASMRKHMPAFNGRLLYSVILTVNVFAYKQLIKRHDRLKAKHDKKMYKKLWRESIDVFKLQTKWFTDLTITGEGAEHAYYGLMLEAMCSKLASPKQSWITLYLNNPFYYVTAQQLIKSEKYSKPNSFKNNRGQEKSRPFGSICKYFQSGTCNKFGSKNCKWDHKCAWCADNEHGMHACDQFLNKAKLTKSDKKSSKR